MSMCLSACLYLSASVCLCPIRVCTLKPLCSEFPEQKTVRIRTYSSSPYSHISPKDHFVHLSILSSPLPSIYLFVCISLSGRLAVFLLPSLLRCPWILCSSIKLFHSLRSILIFGTNANIWDEKPIKRICWFLKRRSFYGHFDSMNCSFLIARGSQCTLVSMRSPWDASLNSPCRPVDKHYFCCWRLFIISIFIVSRYCFFNLILSIPMDTENIN